MFQLRYDTLLPASVKLTQFDKYSIINYIKTELNETNYNTLGLYRSVIIDNTTTNVVCYSLPKSIPYNMMTTKYHISELVAEEFVEGTMINIFWDIYKSEWYITTKKTINADCYFFIHKVSFHLFYHGFKGND